MRNAGIVVAGFLVAVGALLPVPTRVAAQATAGSSSGRGAMSAKSSPAKHWVETWGAAETPARIPSTNLSVARAMQPAGAAGAAPTAPAPAAPAAQIPIAPEMAPASNTAAGGGAPQRRYNLPRGVTNFDDQTVRMILRVSIGGPEIRVRFYNAFGARAVKIGAAHVALCKMGMQAAGDEGPGPFPAPVAVPLTATDPGSDREITFGGKKTATMYAGETLTSDPVRLTVAPLSDIAVSLYFPEETGAPTNHPLGLQPTYTSGPGDFTSAAEISDPTNVSEAYYFLAGVDVTAPADAAAIVTFGDSITDGDQSTPGAYAMWPAILAEHLQANEATKNIAVVNEGISGNRILGDNVSGLSRFAMQALDVPGVKWITVLEGINDINGAMRANPPDTNFSAQDLIAAYEQMIDAAHMRGIKVIGCTLTPYGGSSGYKDQGEAIREEANNWIRTSGKFDAVVDFDKVTRDANDSKRFSPAAESPDLLHPGDAGYKMMAGAFKLSIFAVK